MKGIILAAGRGSRLWPTTKATCKQLLPIFDKPLIYYSLSVLMLAEIREILLITNPDDHARFVELLGDGSQLGLSIEYRLQHEPKGIAEAFLIGESFIGSDPVALILGDNIFHGHNLPEIMASAKQHRDGALIFGYEVHDPERYGVMAFDENHSVIDIIEKPLDPPSRFAVTGLYFYDAKVVEIAKNLQLSARGELEITDVNVAYLKQQALRSYHFERGFAWLDTGTPDAMMKASHYVQTIQERQGIKIGCIEELAYQMGYIDSDQLLALAEAMKPSDYGKYLLSCLPEKEQLGV